MQGAVAVENQKFRRLKAGAAAGGSGPVLPTVSEIIAESR
jgi:hypothetical protein